ncbi:hypothetical protein [Desulfoscipio gibsoniae]|uniref:Uncharacterized protein n=1 Tax=Desulfoscipio gibsoniae DSM 7213 TaxID=767817 RepID=R4KGK1_9FIRM|nr:hypothetical protein [Desulfoscipio gibsoniae]AGL01729.1 hypothetical protein Desgi_2308 [Desulfoscipio gibsoniae DSM 7213]
MAIDRLVEEIRKLTPKQQNELFRKLGIYKSGSIKIKKRGGPDDPLAEIIGIGEGPENGSVRYKEDLYGKDSI